MPYVSFEEVLCLQWQFKVDLTEVLSDLVPVRRGVHLHAALRGRAGSRKLGRVGGGAGAFITVPAHIQGRGSSCHCSPWIRQEGTVFTVKTVPKNYALRGALYMDKEETEREREKEGGRERDRERWGGRNRTQRRQV